MSQEQWSMINGTFCPLQDACLPITDLGILRGFALFDFFRVLESRPIFLDDHLARFIYSADQLHIPLQYDTDQLRTMIHQVIEKNAVPNTGMLLLLTGGTALDGFTPSQPNLVIFQRPLPQYPSEYYDRGIKLISHKYTREFSTIKSTNYAMGVSLHYAMKQAEAVDILYHDGQHISETTRSNIFVRFGNTLCTPDTNILAGITRKQLLQLLKAQHDLEFAVRPILFEDLQRADEVFLTSSTKEVMPVRQIDDIVIGEGIAGSFSKKLLQDFRQHVRAYIMRG